MATVSRIETTVDATITTNSTDTTEGVAVTSTAQNNDGHTTALAPIDKEAIPIGFYAGLGVGALVLMIIIIVVFYVLRRKCCPKCCQRKKNVNALPSREELQNPWSERYKKKPSSPTEIKIPAVAVDSSNSSSSDNGNFLEVVNDRNYPDNSSVIQTMSEWTKQNQKETPKSSRKTSDEGYENQDVINQIAKMGPKGMKEIGGHSVNVCDEDEASSSYYMSMENAHHHGGISPNCVNRLDFEDQIYENHDTPKQSMTNLLRVDSDGQIYQNHGSSTDLSMRGYNHEPEEIYQNTDMDGDSIYQNTSETISPAGISNYMSMTPDRSTNKPTPPSGFGQNVPPPRPHASPYVRRYVNQ